MMIETTIDAPNNSSTNTNPIPIFLPTSYITVYATATAELDGNAVAHLVGTYDGTNYRVLVSQIRGPTTLATPAVGTFSLEQWSALQYAIYFTTTADDSAKDVTFYLVFPAEAKK